MAWKNMLQAIGHSFVAILYEFVMDKNFSSFHIACSKPKNS